jgi:hypothetical protein
MGTDPRFPRMQVPNPIVPPEGFEPALSPQEGDDHLVEEATLCDEGDFGSHVRRTAFQV